MKLQYSEQFEKAYRKLPEDIREEAHKALVQFQFNPRYPSLRVKKMKGFKNIWEAHITLGYVFTFHWYTEGEERIAFLRRIGKHDEVYSNP